MSVWQRIKGFFKSGNRRAQRDAQRIADKDLRVVMQEVNQLKTETNKELEDLKREVEQLRKENTELKSQNQRLVEEMGKAGISVSESKKIIEKAKTSHNRANKSGKAPKVPVINGTKKRVEIRPNISTANQDVNEILTMYDQVLGGLSIQFTQDIRNASDQDGIRDLMFGEYERAFVEILEYYIPSDASVELPDRAVETLLNAVENFYYACQRRGLLD